MGWLQQAFACSLVDVHKIRFFFFSQCDCDCGTLRCEQREQDAGWADLLSQRFSLAATDFCLFTSRRPQNTLFFVSQGDCDCGTLRCEQRKQHAGLTCSVSVFFLLQQTFACSLVDVHKIRFFLSLKMTAIVARSGVSNASKTLG